VNDAAKTVDAGTRPDTFPKLLLEQARARGSKPAIREKDLGVWQTWTWSQVAEEVRAFACGLHTMGFQRGDHLAVVGDNRPRLYCAMYAAQALGGIPVPLYQDAIAEEIAFVLEDAEARFVVAEDQEQVDKLLELKSRLPHLSTIIYDDLRGLRDYEGVHEYAAVQTKGGEFDRANPDFFLDSVDRVKTDDVAVMLYTSGTTGKPKGVCQTYRALLFSARGGRDFDRLSEREEVLSYLPMAWVGDNLFSCAQAFVAGFTINCPESPATVMTDMREIGPTYFFAPPRIFENLLTTVMIRMEDAGAVKRAMFDTFMRVAKRCGAEILDAKTDRAKALDRKHGVSLFDRVLYAIGDVLVYGPLRNVLGMSRIRVAYTAGAAIGPDLFRFYRSIGINLKQLYGSTETCVYICFQPDGDVKLDSVGTPAPGVEIKLTDAGEILVRGEMLLKEYFKRPDATAESLDAQGYFHTGDAGFIDGDGHLKIIDRAKDVGKLSGGSLFAPNFIENKLKFFPHIKEAVAFGHNRDRVCALINIDMGSVGDWAERRGLPYSGYTDLAGKKEVGDLIAECVEKVNAELAADRTMADTQISRFLILHKELDPDEDELTRTRKVRRGFVSEKYAILVDALYSGKTSQFIETQVKFEDGRTGKISADVEIREAKVFGPLAKVA
jgi:long-chain acyl-CoA synthetase